MVLLGASKAARHQASLVNRPTCGGDKKAGLKPSLGSFYVTSNVRLSRAPQRVPPTGSCLLNHFVSKTIQTQKYGYGALRRGMMG
tara:strand:- start:731 stop:985 length:255 start_codon:yes stop_codon:yes gene_type:complete